MRFSLRCLFVFFCFCLVPASLVSAEGIKDTAVYVRLKQKLDAVPGIDTHSHICGYHEALHHAKRCFGGEKPKDCALHYVWTHSYFTWGHVLARWPQDGNFDAWWNAAQANFQDSRARSAYRTMLPIFQDLYGVDFETLSVDQAKRLNARMEKNFSNPDWAYEILRKKANTEIIVADSWWYPNHIRDHLPFVVTTCNTRWFLNGFHPSEFDRFPSDNPYTFAKNHKMPMDSIDDYVAVLDRIIADSKKAGAICLKNQAAYDRSLRFDWVPKKRAAEAFGKPRKELNPAQVKAFQDYIFWRLAELSAKHDMPFQVHTGHARIETSNPMNLVNVIKANRKTKFILFHGGFPWVGESGMIALKYPNVWLDSVWMPVLSKTMGKRAYKEWLDMISSNRIMWGSDLFTIEGTYGTTVYTRDCITEALAEKVVDKELSEKDAERIGRQILRENALEMFPSLRKMVKKAEKR